jgi:hypothetical protein
VPTNYLRGYTLDGANRREYVVDETLVGAGGAYLPRGSYVTVDVNGGGQYTTITAGLAAAGANGVVLVWPGVYAEDIVIDNGKKVRGLAGAQEIVIAGSAAGTTRVTFDGAGTLAECLVQAPSSGALPALVADALTAGELAILDNVVFVGQGGTGPAIQGAGSGELVFLHGVYHNGGTLGDFLNITSGKLVAYGMIANVGVSDAFIKISGTADATIYDVIFQDSVFYSCNAAIECIGGRLGLLDMQLPEGAPPATNGLLISGDGVEIDLGNVHLHGATNDVHVASALTGTGNDITFNAVNFKQERFLNESGLTWINNTVWTGFHVDTGLEDDPGTKFLGKLTVGYPLSASQSCFGTGDSTTLGMLVYTDNGAGTNFLNKTAEAASASGSTFTTQGLLAGQATIYYGMTLPKKFSDIKITLTGLANRNDSLWVAEVWTGAAWQPIQMCVCETSNTYLTRGELPYEQWTTQRIRLDADGPNFAAWAQNDPMSLGSNYYWLRIRNTGTITTGPTIERVKLGFERMQANADGIAEFMGIGEPMRAFYRATPVELMSPSGGANAPGNYDLTVSTNVSYQAPGRFANGADERAGAFVPVPPHIDTSRDIRCTIQWKPATTNTGTVTWDFYLVDVATGAVLGALPEFTNQQTPAGPGTIDQVVTTVFNVKSPDTVPGNSYAFMLWRRGSTDQHTGAVDLISLQLEGTFFI